VVVVPYSLGVSREEVAVDKSLAERQAVAAVAVGLDYPDRTASHSTVAGSILPVALRFPLFGSSYEY